VIDLKRKMFDKEPDIKVLPREKELPFTLVNAVTYYHEGMFCTIEKGFKWNGSDIPRLFWRIVGSQYDPQFLPASLIHDWMLKNNYLEKHNGVWITTQAFRLTLLDYGVGKHKANIMAFAVGLIQFIKKVKRKWMEQIETLI
jgi:hypothetical protein